MTGQGKGGAKHHARKESQHTHDPSHKAPHRTSMHLPRKKSITIVDTEPSRPRLKNPVLANEESAVTKTTLGASTEAMPTFLNAHRPLIVATVVILALAVFFLAYFLLTRVSFTARYCQTDDCISHAAALSAAMDPEVNPCDDFYAFVCGRWKKSAAHDSLRDSLNEEALRNSLAEVRNDLWRHERTSRMYDHCMNRESGRTHSIAGFQQFMKEVRLYWPMQRVEEGTHPLDVMIGMAVQYDVNFLFGLEVVYNTSRDAPVPVVKWGRIGVVWKERLARTVNPTEYRSHVDEHLEVLGARLAGVSHRTLQELESDFVGDIYRSLRSEPNQTWLALQVLDDRTSVERGLWVEFLRKHFEALETRWASEGLIVFEDVKIIDNLRSLFLKYRGAYNTLLIGLSWMFIQSHLWLAAGMPELMFPNGTGDKRQLACLEYVDSRLGLLSSAEHLTNRYKTQETRREVASFFNRTKTQLKAMLSAARWMDAETLGAARKKIDGVAVHALPAEEFFAFRERSRLYRNFPAMDDTGTNFITAWLNVSKLYQGLQRDQHFRDVYSKRTTFRHAPSVYNYLLNTVDMALVALEPPLFYFDAMSSINFAGAGFLFAQEVCRTIDLLGQKVDSSGETVHWWQLIQGTEYIRRLNCDVRGSEDGRAASNSTVGLFPSIPALEVSFAAYRAAVAESGLRELRLHTLEAYSDSQIFFMSLCYALCAKEGVSNGDNCNVPIKHSLAFAQAFRCPPGSAMNVPNKCTFLL